MITTILKWVGITIVVLLILLWLVTGGIGKIIETARNITSPIASIFAFATSTGTAFRLPWQPDYITPNIPDMVDSGGDDPNTSPQSTDQGLSDSERQYDSLTAKMIAAKNFGTPSPYRGQVTIEENNATESAPDREYVKVQANDGNTTPVDITGWSLQSAVSGVRGYIPRGANVFFMGAINPQDDISLSPGFTAILTSGYSQGGTSFRENMCTGYLSQFQEYTPGLSQECPSPSDSLPLSADNIRMYGETCFNFLNELPVCTFPLTTPSDISPSCRAFVQNTISYNGCVQNYRYKSAFPRSQWRVYLGAGAELWRNSHDVVRLLDREGRTVDVLVY